MKFKGLKITVGISLIICLIVFSAIIIIGLSKAKAQAGLPGITNPGTSLEATVNNVKRSDELSNLTANLGSNTKASPDNGTGTAASPGSSTNSAASSNNSNGGTAQTTPAPAPIVIRQPMMRTRAS